MREIKFRAWDKNQMFHIPLTSHYGLGRFFEILSEDAKVMQFTGLKDKNGKEIYEGDICLNEDGDKRQICYHYNSFEMRLMNGNRSKSNIVWHHTCEVIGNIYENPNLINQ